MRATKIKNKRSSGCGLCKPHKHGGSQLDSIRAGAGRKHLRDELDALEQIAEWRAADRDLRPTALGETRNESIVM